MARQLILVLGASVVCAACASEPVAKPFGLGASHVATVTAVQRIDPFPGTTMKKTMASKVLAAMALERVTGRKPDPGRLTADN